MNTYVQGTLPNIIASIITFINNVLVPFVFALAFAIFLFGVFKYFFVNGVKDPKARGEGRNFILWSVIAFAVLVSVWGLVNLVKGTFNLNNNQPGLPTFNAASNGTSGSGGIFGGSSNPSGGVPAGSNASGGVPAGSSATTNGSNISDPVNGLY
jgi:predicted PurR-regulated permease PerM